MKKKPVYTECPKCGETQFATEKNSYDIFEIVDNVLTYVESVFDEEELILHCKNCGELIDLSNVDVDVE